MGNGIEVRFKYGGTNVICDDAALARLREHICSEASVAEAIGNASEATGARFITVRPPADQSASKGPGWYAVIATVVAGSVSGVVYVVGFVTIIRWAMRLVA